MDRRETVQIFRERLAEVIERSGFSRAKFAGEVGLDRSTLSQLLSDENARLPRAENIVAIARRAKVSVDWLLGLSQEGQVGTDVLLRAMQIEPGASSPVDARLAQWHAQAVGYKIRYIPTTLPDLLKSEAVIRYEYRKQGEEIPQAVIAASESRLAYSRRPETDMEVCSSFQSVESFARAEGIWRSLPREDRLEQLERMITLLDELYPTLRWFLFDGRRNFSAPMTIFGPQRVAIYLGDTYFVFNSTEHIRHLTRHFDDLIRAASVQPPDVVRLLGDLCHELRRPTASKNKERRAAV